MDTKDFLVGCPKGDWESLKLTLGFDEDGVPRDIEKTEIKLEKPDTVAIFWNQGDINADSAATYGTTIRTTITHSCFSRDYVDTCDIDSVALVVKLNDTTLCDTASLIVKSPDYTGDGKVNISDFVYFSEAYTSEEGDSNYNEWFEYTGNDIIDSTDYSMWGSHYTHKYAHLPSFRFKFEEESDAKLRFVITQPEDPSKSNIAHLQIFLKDVLDITTHVIGLDYNHSDVEYARWIPNPEFPGKTIVSPIFWNGRNPVMIGGHIMALETNNSTKLGVLKFRLKGDNTFEEIGSMGLTLLFGDVLDKNGSIEKIRTIEFEQKNSKQVTPVFRNYLASNYPNPFNPTTTIEYSIAKDAHVNLSIYNANGQLVRTLVDEHQKRNNYKYMWSGKDNRGQMVASGIYFMRMKTEAYEMTKKLVILR